MIRNHRKKLELINARYLIAFFNKMVKKKQGFVEASMEFCFKWPVHGNSKIKLYVGVLNI